MSTRVYAYGARPPIDRDLAFSQIQAAHRYYNTLIEIERARRSRAEAILLDQTAEAIAHQIEALAITKPVKGSPEHKMLNDLRAQAKQHRAANRLAMAPLLAKSNDEAASARKRARAATECYWGTYLQVEAAAEAAAKAITPPAFRRWDGTGLMAVQIQGGMTAELALSCTDKRFRIEVLAPASDSRTAQTKRRAIVWMRAGSNEDRSPVWCRVPVLLHRPLPANGSIKWIKLIKQRVANIERWSLQITVSDETEPVLKAGPACGIDIGWRKRDNGIRVAYVWGPEGGQELVVPDAIFKRLEHSESIRAIRDRATDELRAVLIPYLRDAPLPEPMRQAVSGAHAWRAAARFARLKRTWIEHDGDSAMRARLADWLKQDIHLWQWEAFERRGALNARNKLYEAWALQLAKTFGVVCIEDLDLSELARKERALPGVSGQRHASAAGEFRARLLQTCKREGVRVVGVPAPHTTAVCASCGSVESWDRRIIEHTCSACATTWDQDENAAKNILASGEVVVHEGHPAEAPHKPLGRFTRRAKRAPLETMPSEHRSAI